MNPRLWLRRKPIFKKPHFFPLNSNRVKQPSSGNPWKISLLLSTDPRNKTFHALIRTYQHGVSLSRFKINFIEKYSDGFLQHLLVYFYILWLQWHYFTNRCTTLIFTKIDTIIQTIFYQIIYSKNLQVGMNKWTHLDIGTSKVYNV